MIVYKQTYINVLNNCAYSLDGKDVSDRNGFRDMADFTKWRPNAEIIGVFQEQTGASTFYDCKYYTYKIFYKVVEEVKVETKVP